VVDIKTRRKMMAILRVLNDAPSPMGSRRILETLACSGIDLGERTVRNYLAQADGLGWTENLGRRGRRLTPRGTKELEGAFVVDKVGFISSLVDNLTYQMDFNLTTRKGQLILNISMMDLQHAGSVSSIMGSIFEAELGMGQLAGIAGPGEKLGGILVPERRFAIGTVCSVSLNGILLHANIATRNRFGGLLELEGGRPRRFTQIINYDGSSLDPLEVFIRGQMTSVTKAALTGSGRIGASFREVPAVALPEVRRLEQLSRKFGTGGVLAIGSPGQPLLDIPVAPGNAGLIVAGGLNPVAGIVEEGIEVSSAAMSTLCDFSELVSWTAMKSILENRGLLRKTI
jgi:HTH-type transcriptional regulator, global nitrogen regulator NrpRI